KAEIPNPQGKILPGALVHAQAALGEDQDALVIPQQALLRGKADATVYVVDDNSRIADVRVTLAQTYQGLTVIAQGSEEEQRDVVDDPHFVRPGMIVKVEETAAKRAVEALADRPTGEQKAP